MSNKIMREFVLLLIMGCIFGIDRGSAHPISLSSAKVKISERLVSMTIALFPEDLILYQRISPNEDGYLEKSDILEAMESHKRLIENDIYVISEDGTRLKGRVTGIKGISFDVKGLAMSKVMDKKIIYTLVYPLEKFPKTLTFFQTFGGGKSFPALIDMVVEQKGYLPLAPFRLSSGGNKNTVQLGRKNRGTQLLNVHELSSNLSLKRKKLLFELKVPLTLAAMWIPLVHQHPFKVTKDEKDKIVSALGEYISKRLTLKTKENAKRKISVSWLGGEQSFITGRVLFRHQVEFMASDVAIELSWEGFNAQVYEIPITIISTHGVESRAFLTSYQPKLQISEKLLKKL